MLVILPREYEKRWLDNNLEKEIELMLSRYDANMMEAYPIDGSITNLGFSTSNPPVQNEKEYTVCHRYCIVKYSQIIFRVLFSINFHGGMGVIILPKFC